MSLLKRSVRVSCDQVKFKVTALFDGGATNSFVRFSSLPSLLQDRFSQFKASQNASSPPNLGLKSCSIVGATGTVTELCVVASFRISFGDWSGSHKFICTEKLHDKDMIIGREFLKAYNVIIDHGHDRITLDKRPHNASDLPSKILQPQPSLRESTVCVTLDTVVIEPYSEKLIKCAVNQLEGAQILFLPDLDLPILAAFSVSCCGSGGVFTATVMNPTNKPVTLERHKRVGVFTSDFEVVANSSTVEAKTVNVNHLTVPTPAKKPFIDKVSFGKNLSPEQKSKLIQLLLDKSEAFQQSDTDMGLTDPIEHEIRTGNHPPIKQRPYRIPATVKDEVTKQTQEMLSSGIIEESCSPWASPMMIVKLTTR